MTFLRTTIAALCLGPFAAKAEGRLNAVDAAFEAWLAQHDAKGVLALFDLQTLLGHAAHGITEEAVIEVASLSKAITGLCVEALVQDGVLSWDSRFSDIHGSGPDATLAELATHTSGLWPDGTQLGMLTWLDDPSPRAEDVLALIEQRGGQAGEPGAFRYNNENYALLGLAIEAVTQMDYATSCRASVLMPAGAGAEMAQRSGGFGPWGGWGMTVADYGRMMAHWFAPGQPLAKDPDAGPLYLFPGTPTGNLHYGRGVYVRPSGDGYNYWHFGALCFPGRLDTAAFAMTLHSGETMVLAYDTCLPDEAVLEMQGVLITALKDARAE